MRTQPECFLEDTIGPGMTVPGRLLVEWEVGSESLMNMNTPESKGHKMEVLIPVGILVVWFTLQAWVLPRFGVKT